MDQTAVYVDMNGRTTVDFVGSPTVDIVQGSAVNGFRLSVFLAASATGEKLPPFVVFAGVPGRPVSQEVFSPSFGATTVEHTVQKNAYCDATGMLDWIERLTNVEFVCQPMDVSVMKAFKNYVTNAYLQYHNEHPLRDACAAVANCG
ncbi:uncharacterized protein IUM83_03205 [Phytophthora cinnamomi]|uniref:uncharacterized protein n=1 Tax=Phytophthora cinnamomi TaxID=4785 RepID=UPI00355A2A9A|nr:hypothetical protein IUM83_03205 [Phytophthora cinnamomi]